MAYLTTTSFSRIASVPLTLPQTNLSRGQIIQVASIQLNLGETLRIAWLNLHLVNILTPQAVPAIFNQKSGLVSACVSTSLSTSGQGCNIGVNSPGAVALNPYYATVYKTPAVYTILVANNASNADASVVLTGMARIFRA